jgi:flagellar biosynthesis protein FlhF
MQIKRFEAKNMTEALRQIKRELGSEAVILSAKDLRREHRLLGISRKVGVEVTAAVDEDAPGQTFTPETSPPKFYRDKQRLGAVRGSDQWTAAGSLMNAVVDRVNLKGRGGRLTTPSSDRDPAVVAAGDRETVSHGVRARSTFSDEMASVCGQNVKRRQKTRDGLSVGTLILEKRRPNLVALVGNAGVGKTTTIAKLAALYKCRHKETVGLLSLDGRRIGALEQMQVYAASMGLPLADVRREEDVPYARKRLKACRLILVDCPAVDPANPKRLKTLQSHLNALGSVTTLLTLSAESREEDLQDTARRCAHLKPRGVVVTKTDLTRSGTDLANFLCREGLPVYFVSHGERVPFDLSVASLEELANRFFKQGPAAPSINMARSDEPRSSARAKRSTEASVYLANKSSDIFHRPGCKWIRLINQANIVEFDSFAEALNHRFKPCRYCNPQHISIAGLLSEESAAQ